MAARAVAIVKRFCKIDTIEIDSCIEETHTLSNTITDHPVEEGFNISDHSRPNPDAVQLRCFVSNTPLSAKQQSRDVKAGNVDFTTSSAADASPIGQVGGAGDNAFTALNKLRSEGTLITLVTTLKTYESTSTQGMIIESISIPRTTKNYDGLEFSITLKQIRIVQNQRTRDTQPKDKRVSKPKKKGEQTPTAATENQDSKLVQMGLPGAN